MIASEGKENVTGGRSKVVSGAVYLFHVLMTVVELAASGMVGATIAMALQVDPDSPLPIEFAFLLAAVLAVAVVTTRSLVAGVPQPGASGQEDEDTERLADRQALEKLAGDVAQLVLMKGEIEALRAEVAELRKPWWRRAR